MEKIKIMTYNVQCFGGVNDQLAVQKKIMDKYGAHVVGIQELTTTGKINSIGRAALAEYPNIYIADHKSYTGIASKLRLYAVRTNDFKAQDPEDQARYGETRSYMTAKGRIGDKDILFINTHLCFHTKAIKYQQMWEIFERSQKSGRVIITGDFNCFSEKIGDEEYTRMYKPFLNAGYQMADCGKKITKTWTDKTDPRYLSRFTYPTDNIIVSQNITIKKVYFDRTKLAHPNGYPMDHIPIIARLYIR